MEQPLLGETAVFVVRLEQAADGEWALCIESAEKAVVLPLAPALFIIQLWRASEAKLLRGTIQLHGSRHAVSVQTSTQLIDLLQAWLCSDGCRDLPTLPE